MQRTPVIIFLSGLLIIGCTNNPSHPVISTALRDTSITADNAFTHLVLDSAFVRQFISATVSDSLTATTIIDFYNTRNYQFAWFNEEGLTEQAEAFWSIHQQETKNYSDSTAYSKKLH